MEGDPRARIAPWASGEDRTAHSEDAHSSASPEAPQRAHDALPSSSSAPAHGEGLQAAGWGDVGDFSLGTLDAPSMAANDQSGQAEPQQRSSHRLAGPPHAFPCKGRACRPTAAPFAQRGSTLVWLQPLKDASEYFALLARPSFSDAAVRCVWCRAAVRMDAMACMHTETNLIYSGRLW